jgi:hypothetical protein
MKNNIAEWDTEDVLLWIKKEVGPKTVDEDLIRAHEIDGRDLLDLTEDNLKHDLKIIKLHDRKLFLRKLCELMKLICYINSDNYEDENILHQGNKKIHNNDNRTSDCSKNNNSSAKSNSELIDSAIKNNYVSFEALDNWEKNGYTFSIKKNMNPDKRVTINSFYNISNLNNYNTKKVLANKSLDTLTLGENETKMRKAQIMKNESSEIISPRGKESYYSHSFSQKGKNVQKNSQDTVSNESQKLYYKKDNFFDKLYNYYNEAKKIKSRLLIILIDYFS